MLENAQAYNCVKLAICEREVEERALVDVSGNVESEQHLAHSLGFAMEIYSGQAARSTGQFRQEDSGSVADLQQRLERPLAQEAARESKPGTVKPGSEVFVVVVDWIVRRGFRNEATRWQQEMVVPFTCDQGHVQPILYSTATIALP